MVFPGCVTLSCPWFIDWVIVSQCRWRTWQKMSWSTWTQLWLAQPCCSLTSTSISSSKNTSFYGFVWWVARGFHHLTVHAMQLVSLHINAFPSRCGWAWTYSATHHRCASRSAITSKFSFSEYLLASPCPPVRSHHPAQLLRGKKMVWGASTMGAGWVGERGEVAGSSTTSRMAAVELFILVFMVHCSIFLWFLTVRLITACSLGAHVQMNTENTVWSQCWLFHLQRVPHQDLAKLDRNSKL